MSTPPARPGPGVRAAVAGIIVAAAALRLWNIGSGIPYAVGPDEPQVMNRVAHMMKTGDFNPHFFDWPTLTFYLNLIVSCFTFLAGAMRGAWSHLDQVSAAELYLAGRQFTAILGAATVALTFAAGRRWGNPVALVAAALMAVIPGHVRESHFVLTDVPTAFFTTLALLMALRAYERQTWSAFAWAGAAAGLAASCKYNGSMAIVMPIAVIAGAGGAITLKVQRLLIVLGAMALAFLIGTPYAVLDLPAFLNDYARLAASFARERGGDPGWWIYLKHVSGALAWPAFVAALVGLILSIRQGISGPDRVRGWVLVAFAAVYFTVLARSYQIYGRYMLPLYPVLSICAAVGVMAAVRLLPRLRLPAVSRLGVSGAIVAAVLVTPVIKGIGYSRELGRPSTVDLAYQWIRTHVPNGARIIVEAGAMQLPPQYPSEQVRSLLVRSPEEYQKGGAQYLIAASADFQTSLVDPNANPEVFTAYRRLLGEAVEVAAFDPAPKLSGPRLRIFQLVK
jgi:4-amino-4-deoxy-L-arabinose transferase-like glycosyltransferase